MHPVFLAVALSLAPLAAETDRQVVDSLVYDLDLSAFHRQRFSMKRLHPHLDWSTDGCSAPFVGSEGRSFNFRRACVRHDFAYRNYKRLGIFDETTRVALDERFRLDMLESCEPRRRTFRIRCLAWAEVFHAAVRAAGGI
jgi:hypothetical protein